ncbi:FAD-linked oxidoreductase-like protein [Paraphysoderma sedebokerense]|nr:FAD-linked oxidoreductase-like protein [Paraphysoderma sedebokerense]
MAEFKKAGIGSILDISIESDLQERSIKPGSADDTENVRKLANQKAEEAKDLIRKCVEAASLEPNSYAAIKVTALGPTVVLKKISSSLRTVIQKFKEVDVDCDGKITISEFKSLVSALPGAKSVDDKTVTALFNSYSKKSSMDFISLMQLFSFDNPASVSLLCHPNDNTLSASDTTTLTHTDVSEFKILISRMDEVCELARNKKVKLMIDAEQTYFQDAIDYVALEMSKKYNKIEKKSKNVKPMIYNTYQLYLKEGNSKMVNDYSRAEREGWAFAAKLVRGAYMISERKRASTLSYPSPINDTLADTHASYNSALSFLISRLPSNPTTSICVASHNKDSIILTAKLMSVNGIKNDDERIVFGQLKGMYDLLSYGLASKGYRGYKYIPYGPVEEVIPYLLRRYFISTLVPLPWTYN